MIDFRSHIEIIPGKRSGQPCIKGTRITVYDVLGWLAGEMTVDEILYDFPEINKHQILACLAYAAAGKNTVALMR
ncbi:MAG: DUF433 domain-containing protein [Leeuwenhoekiella sp.]